MPISVVVMDGGHVVMDGNSEGDLFTGGDTEEIIQSGCAAGNAACT